MTTAAPNIAAENKAAADGFASAKIPPTVPRWAAARRGPRTPSQGMPVMVLLIVMGLATLAACVLIPLREERRQLAHALDDLIAERDHLAAQSASNRAFVEHMHSDPALAERLTMRVTRKPADGKKFLDAETVGSFDSSPYAITDVAPPPPRQPYVSDLPPVIGQLFVDSWSRIVLMGAGLFLLAAAVILGKESSTASAAA